MFIFGFRKKFKTWVLMRTALSKSILEKWYHWAQNPSGNHIGPNPVIFFVRNCIGHGTYPRDGARCTTSAPKLEQLTHTGTCHSRLLPTAQQCPPYSGRHAAITSGGPRTPATVLFIHDRRVTPPPVPSD